MTRRSFGSIRRLPSDRWQASYVGPDHRRLLPASLLAGAVFLVLCDSLGRILLHGMEIRVGIMTAFIGTPYFLYLLRRHMKMVA